MSLCRKRQNYAREVLLYFVQKFKKYLDNALLRKEKSEALERLRGGGMKKIEGGMAEKEITIRIEVET